MKHNKGLLAIISITLTCQLTLMACQQRSDSLEIEHSKTHKSEKKNSKTKTVKSQKKEIPGIDKATDDGFLFSNESQIETKTDEGLVVKHGNHSHFLFYSDLKGTKWDYLIPEDFKEKKTTTSTKQSVQTKAQLASRFQTEDGYIFNPKDIVAEDVKGYTVRHGDHYHYILKGSLGRSDSEASVTSPSYQRAQADSQYHSNNSGNNTTVPALIGKKPHKGQIRDHYNKLVDTKQYPGIHFATDDKFLFDGNHIIDSNDFGALVAHNGNLKDIHVIPYYQLVNTKWENLIPERYMKKAKADYFGTSNNIPEQPEKPDTTTLNPKLEEKIQSIMQQYGLSRDQLSIDPSKNLIMYPHGNHFHAEPIDSSKPFTDPIESQPIYIDGENFEERKERLIKEYMDRFGVKREDITVEDNYMSIRHGDHAHVYKIDPRLPDDPERDVKTESTNLEVEDKLVYGPLFSEGSKVSLTRKGVYDTFKPTNIKNIKNFILLTFSTNSEYGDLEVNGKKTKRVYYLVRKDLNWEDLHINRPNTVTHEGKLFKGWSADLPTSGKMQREHQAYYVDFDRVRKQPTKDVYTPSDDVRDIDISHYVPIKYTTLLNGQLQFGDKIQGGFTFYVNPKLTWIQAKKAGLTEPTPIPHDHYEFIEYRNIVNGSEDENSNISPMISLAAFGSTAPYLGPYIASNPNLPTDINDPNRHPNYYWHNPKNYVAVAFKINEGGELISPNGKGKAIVYLLRKGLSLEQAKIIPPFIQYSDRSQQYYFDIVKEYSKPITEDTVYQAQLRSTSDPFDDLLGDENDHDDLLGEHNSQNELINSLNDSATVDHATNNSSKQNEARVEENDKTNSTIKHNEINTSENDKVDGNTKLTENDPKEIGQINSGVIPNKVDATENNIITSGTKANEAYVKENDSTKPNEELHKP
ncbi:pneumococcal-type histidine triad protein [Streptococcus sp. 20-1249]|uniref:pneumococcal-type histidine triad protein n=1 Tax=Streptococcus hepaticus TaxID=3349163 RepID=UPI003749E20C